MRNLFGLLLIIATCMETYFLQLNYRFLPDHCEITDINQTLVKFYMAKCTKFSRTELHLNMNFSFKMNITTDRMGQILFTGYQFKSNEYRKGPIEFMLGLCSAGNSKLYDIQHMLSNSNIKCPYITDRVYYIYDLSPNATNMPPLIPEGKWMFQIKYIYFEKYVMFTIKWFVDILYDFNVWNK